MAINSIFIKNLEVDNFKSLKNSKIDLNEGLNILIGKNGAGKSNVLEFIYRYASRNVFNTFSRGFPTNFSVSLEYLQNMRKNILTYSIERAKRNIDSPNPHVSNAGYEIIFSKSVDGKKVFENKGFAVSSRRMLKKELENSENFLNEFEVLRSLRKKFITFQLPSDQSWLLTPSRLVIDEDYEITFDDSYSDFGFFFNVEIEIELGSNVSKRTLRSAKLMKKYLVRLLDKFLEESMINNFLVKYTPISQVRFNPNINVYIKDKTTIIENLVLEFLIEDDWIPWSYLSDGTKRLFYLISETISINNGILLVEEPELGVHPHQLYKVLEFLKDQSKTKQIIISTHSPLSLDILTEEELGKIIIAKYEKGTKFYKLNETEINKAKKYINQVGDLSYYWLHSDLEQ